MWRHHAGPNDYPKNIANNLICNFTNKKLLENSIAFKVGNGNLENSKIFEGLVILKTKKTGKVKTTQPHTYHTLDILFSSSCLLSFILLSFLSVLPVLFRLLFSLFLCVLSFCLCLSMALSPCVVVCRCCGVLLCVVAALVCCCELCLFSCVVVCVVWCVV